MANASPCEACRFVVFVLAKAPVVVADGRTQAATQCDLVSCSAPALALTFYGLNLALAAWRIHCCEPGWWSSFSCHAGASHRIEHLADDRPLAAASGAWGTSLKWTLCTPLSIWAWGGAP